jgi:uncharacterized protein
MRRVGMISVLAVAGLAGHCAAADAQSEAKTTRARTLLGFLVDGKYREFTDAGTERMKTAMGPKETEQVWTGITSQLGQYRSEISAKPTKVMGFYSVQMVCRFDRGKASLRIVLDDADRLAGLWIDRVDRDVAYTQPAYVNSELFREEKVTVSAGQFPLPGTLTLPKAAGPHPAVVLVHGSGPHDEDETIGANKPFRDLAGGLASRRIAVLRYEKRTHKHPTATKPADWTIETETMDDALAAANLLLQRPEIDPKRVFVAGHSLGAFAAPFIAQRDPKLAGIVLLAGNARSILDLIEDQIEYLAGLSGSANDEARKRVGEMKEALEAIRAGKLEGTSEKLGMPAAYLERLHKLDPVGAAAALKMPILIIQGGRDYQVTKADFAIWKKQMADKQNVTLKLYEPLNHLFVAGEGPSAPAEYEKAGHVDERVVADIAEWVTRQPG